MRQIEHRFPWSDITTWAWTDDDIKLLQVINDVNDVEAIIEKYVPADRRNIVIQAGAACGIWPHRLSKMFNWVISLEPLPDNFECAAENLRTVNNIMLINGALGSGEEGDFVFMKQHPHERNNAGSQQVDLLDGPVRIGCHQIDKLTPRNGIVDFIALDLEGYEKPALMGAEETIKRCMPVIMVEDKGLSLKFGIHKDEVIGWLLARGYHIAERIKRDVVLVPNDPIPAADLIVEDDND
jgi:FkbM family methyltransferase